MSNGNDKKISRKGSEDDRERTRERIDRRRGPDDRFFEDISALTKDVRRDLENKPFDELMIDLEFDDKLERLARMEEMLGDLDDLPEIEHLPLFASGKKGLDEVRKEVKKQSEEEKTAVFENYHYALFGLALTGAAAGIAYLVMRRIANDQSTSDLALDDATKAKCKELIQKWQYLSDAEFWNNFANVVDTGLVLDGVTHSWTAADQVVFLKLTADLCPATMPFQWDKVADADANAKAIKAFYDQTKKTSDLYRNVLQATYNGEPLQRMWAANQLMLVVGSMIETT